MGRVIQSDDRNINRGDGRLVKGTLSPSDMQALEQAVAWAHRESWHQTPECTDGGTDFARARGAFLDCRCCASPVVTGLEDSPWTHGLYDARQVLAGVSASAEEVLGPLQLVVIEDAYSWQRPIPDDAEFVQWPLAPERLAEAESATVAGDVFTVTDEAELAALRALRDADRDADGYMYVRSEDQSREYTVALAPILPETLGAAVEALRASAPAR